jgi:hypothetical protein
MIDIRQDGRVTTKPAKKGKQAKKAQPGNPQAAEAAAEKQPAGPLPERKPVEAWLKTKRVPAPFAAALWRYTRWGRGRLVTEQQFQEALAALHTRPASEV